MGPTSMKGSASMRLFKPRDYEIEHDEKTYPLQTIERYASGVWGPSSVAPCAYVAYLATMNDPIEGTKSIVSFLGILFNVALTTGAIFLVCLFANVVVVSIAYSLMKPIDDPSSHTPTWLWRMLVTIIKIAVYIWPIIVCAVVLYQRLP